VLAYLHGVAGSTCHFQLRILPPTMTQLRTTVLMKTDIAGSTPQFRALLASDLQAALSAHRALVARLAAEEGGRIFKASGRRLLARISKRHQRRKVRDRDA
jgi:class 3 adenylate cyclase